MDSLAALTAAMGNIELSKMLSTTFKEFLDEVVSSL